MVIEWKETHLRNDDASPMLRTASDGEIYMDVLTTKEGNMPYEVYVVRDGRKYILARAAHNVKDKHQIDAQARCEFIAGCLKSGVMYEPLEKESKSVSESILPNHDITYESKIVGGLRIDRVYRYDGARGIAYYQVFSVMDTTAERWCEVVGYRNIITGEEYGRPLIEFTEDKYQLLNIGAVIPNPHDFKIQNTLSK